MRGNRVSGNWLMKWDELKKFRWYTHRLMHRKRVTSEPHDSYFRPMTITQAIPKIAEGTHPDRQISEEIVEAWKRVHISAWELPVEFQTIGDEMWQGKPHPTEGALGNPDGVWGPEKMLIRCSKESQHPAEWALGLQLSSPREQERHNVTVITVGSSGCSLCSVSSSLSQ